MKKIYFPLLLLLLVLGGRTTAQTYVQGDILLVELPMMSHDTTICASTCNLMYNITIQNSFTGDSVFVVDVASGTLLFSDGNMNGASAWSLMVPIPINPYVPDNQLNGGTAYFNGPTVKVVCGPDTIYNISNFFSLAVPNPCGYGPVTGRVYIDHNNDCSFNGSDEALSAIPVASNSILSSPNMQNLGTSAYSDMTGSYSMDVQSSWLVSYNVAIPSNLQFIFPASTCAPGSYTFTATPQSGVDFPLQCTSNVDVQCAASSPGAVRPGVPFYLNPFVSNTGCDTASGQLVLIKDSHAIYNAALSGNPAGYVNGDTLIWSYSNLSNISNGAYWNSFFASVHLTPDASVNIGDSLCFQVTANAPSNDVNLSNNIYSFCLPVVNSYDPNVKEVSPKGDGPNGNIPASTSELTYTIHFQNTGTAAAYNVAVVDTLDGDIQPKSLQLLGSSHSVYPEWLAPGVVKFNFYNINLPDSLSNEAASHGSVMFTVQLNNSLPLGTQIHNKASIFFDANPAIVTNTVTNTIAAPSGIVQVAGVGDKFVVYPNPASDDLTIETREANGFNGAMLILQNVSGQIVNRQMLKGNKCSIDISLLQQGIYWMKIVSGKETYVIKLLKD